MPDYRQHHRADEGYRLHQEATGSIKGWGLKSTDWPDQMWRRLWQRESRLEEPWQLQRGQTHQEIADKARRGSGRENGEEKLRRHQRASRGFSQLPSALTSQGYGIPPRPSMRPKLGRTYTSGILFQLLAVQKARSPVQGEDGSSALVVLSPPIFLLRVKGITELEPGLAKDAEG